MQKKTYLRQKFQDFNICHNISYADADAEPGYSKSSSALKCRKKGICLETLQNVEIGGGLYLVETWFLQKLSW